MHWSYTGGLENNPPGVYIANIEDPATLGNFLANPPAPRGPGAGRGAGGGSGRGGRGGGGFGGAAQAHSPAYYIKVSAMPDGSFTVTNTRNNFSKTYAAKK